MRRAIGRIGGLIVGVFSMSHFNTDKVFNALNCLPGKNKITWCFN